MTYAQQFDMRFILQGGQNAISNFYHKTLRIELFNNAMISPTGKIETISILKKKTLSKPS